MSSDADPLRILDANRNRAAEALRVAEDVCRFHWNLAGFARELKDLRHRLLAVTETVAGGRVALTTARNIEGDVGRETETESQADASRLGDIAARNLQRVREAVRVLEEVVRGEDPDARRELQGVRYAAYALEKAFAALESSKGRRHARLESSHLYLLATESICTQDREATVAAALEGGVDIVQLREKGDDSARVLDRARSLRELTARAGALFVINDRPDLALLSQADGVHVGQDDLSIADVRAVVGDELLVGVSTHSTEDARAAVRQGADYIGVGPMFPTTTKDAGPIFGPDGLAAVLGEVLGESVLGESVLGESVLPAFAIGGIDSRNIEELRAVGGTRVAVSSAILTDPDPRAASATLRAALLDDS